MTLTDLERRQIRNEALLDAIEAITPNSEVHGWMEVQVRDACQDTIRSLIKQENGE